MKSKVLIARIKMRKRKHNLFLLNVLVKNNSGIILILVLWVLVILTTLALSLGRRTFVDMSLTSHFKGRLKAKYFAWAGLNYAKGLIRQDSKDEDSNNVDTLYFCGIRRSFTEPLKDLFNAIVVGDGFFDIYYEPREAEEASEVKTDEIYEPGKHFGFEDQERFLNINGINSRNVAVLRQLIYSLIQDKETSDIIAYSVLDWKDPDDAKSHKSFGAEEEYYGSLERPYFCKNAAFDSLQELMLVRGVTQEIYQRLKDHITIYPQKGELKVNFNTASSTVLSALGEAILGDKNQTDQTSFDSLVEKMIAYRKGEDGRAFTEDDRSIEYRELSLTSAEKNLFLRLNQYRINRSSYFKVNVKGTDPNRKISSSLEAIIRRRDLSIVHWKR